MIYLTQLIYLKEGQEAVFHEFESQAIPIISHYKGQLLLRLRPDPSAYLEVNIEPPYEIHLVSFESQEDFERFMRDKTRKQFLHLKEQSIRAQLLIKGVSL